MAEQPQTGEAGIPVTPTPQQADVSATPDAPAKEPPATVKPLTPEEQMALYEEQLKEDDWGHQPC
jgi:hypothetical protein